MKCTYLVPIPPETSLPPARAEVGVQLQYPRADDSGLWDGGFSCVGDVPQANVCIVLIDSSPETHAAMQADPKYVFIEVIEQADLIL